jgi:hypothetical protein
MWPNNRLLPDALRLPLNAAAHRAAKPGRYAPLILARGSVLR